MAEKIKVCIVDDDAIVRQGLKLIIEKDDQIIVVGEFQSGLAAIAGISQLKLDIVLLEYALPDVTGLEVLTRIRNKIRPSVKIICVTRSNNSNKLMRMLDAGINGILIKDYGFSCIEAIKSVHAGKHYIQPDISKKLIDHVKNRSILAGLTNREIEVLLMCSKKNSNEKIAENLCLSTRTISNIKWIALKKLNIDSIHEFKDLYEQCV